MTSNFSVINPLMKISFYFLIACLALVVYVRFLEATMLFLPARKIHATPADAGLPYEDVYFNTRDHVRLNGWLIKAKDNSTKAATVLYAHGNAGNIGDRVEKIEFFHRLDVNVFIYDYRGYGRSLGRATEQGMYDDTLAAFHYLRSRSDLDPDKIVGYGASLGGAAVADLATREKIAALIMDSTFTSAADMGKRIAPFVPSFLLTVKLDSASKLRDLKTPKLFIHSRNDETVPFQLGKKLYDQSPEPREFLEITGSHQEGYAQSEAAFVEGIGGFLKQYNLL